MPDTPHSKHGASPTNSNAKDELILETSSLTKQYGSFTALSGVDIQVRENEFHSIIGPNGAGKTTFFNVISGTLPPSAGHVVFEGNDITGLDEDALARNGIIRVFQIPQVFNELSIQENLRLAVQSTDQSFNPLKQPKEAWLDRTDEMLNRISLDVAPSLPANNLSHGDRKKLEIGMALVADPKLLLLDEPTSGVSEAESEGLIEFLSEATTDLTVILIEHNMDMVLKMSDRVSVLHQGEVIATDTADSIQENQRVQNVYLGEA